MMPFNLVPAVFLRTGILSVEMNKDCAIEMMSRPAGDLILRDRWNVNKS
jgi:hypothetical protein